MDSNGSACGMCGAGSFLDALENQCAACPAGSDIGEPDSHFE